MLADAGFDVFLGDSRQDRRRHKKCPGVPELKVRRSASIHYTLRAPRAAQLIQMSSYQLQHLTASAYVVCA